MLRCRQREPRPFEGENVRLAYARSPLFRAHAKTSQDDLAGARRRKLRYSAAICLRTNPRRYDATDQTPIMRILPNAAKGATTAMRGQKEEFFLRKTTPTDLKDAEENPHDVGHVDEGVIEHHPVAQPKRRADQRHRRQGKGHPLGGSSLHHLDTFDTCSSIRTKRTKKGAWLAAAQRSTKVSYEDRSIHRSIDPSIASFVELCFRGFAATAHPPHQQQCTGLPRADKPLSHRVTSRRITSPHTSTSSAKFQYRHKAIAVLDKWDVSVYTHKCVVVHVLQ